MTITQRLDSGSSSFARVVDGCVIRTPQTNQDADKWLKAAKNECLITKELQKTACVVPLAVLVDNALVSPFFDGKPMDEQTYLSLSPEKQKVVSDAFADFLWQLHHLKRGHFIDERYTSDKLKQKIKNVVLPKDIQSIMEKTVDIIAQDSRVRTQTGICHNDLIKDNILFDKEQNKLGVIDFGDADLGSVYRDFGSLYRPGQLGEKFVFDVVTQYNKTSQRQHEPEIDFVLVKQVALLRTFEKLRHYEGKVLEKKLSELRNFNQKLFPQKINMPAFSVFISENGEK